MSKTDESDLEERRVVALERIADALDAVTGRSGTKQQEDRIAEGLETLGRVSLDLSKLVEAVETHARTAKNYWWFKRFMALESAVTRDTLENMKAALDHHVLKPYSDEVFQKLGPEGFETWLKHLLYIQRVYEYILFTEAMGGWSVLYDEPVEVNSKEYWTRAETLEQYDYAVVRWIHELAHDREFQMAHLRQGAYYRSFAEKINRVFESEAKALRDQATRRKERGTEKELALAAAEEKLATEIERAAQRNVAEAEFERFQRDLKESAEKRRIATFILSKGGDPDNKEDFIYLWVRYPGLKDDGTQSNLEVN